MISQIAGLGAGRAAQALRELAKLHAEWWASPALDGLTWMPRLDDPVNLAAGQQYRDAWPLFVERIGDAVPAEALALGERVKEQYESLLVVGTADAPLTICHGDFRADNLMFDDAPEAEDAIAVLDWQISFRGPAVSDVTYLLCQSMTVEERRASEEALVRAWYDALLDAGVPQGGYPFDLAWQHHERGMLAATVYPVTAMGALDAANDRGRELVANMAVRAFTAALDHDAARTRPWGPEALAPPGAVAERLRRLWWDAHVGGPTALAALLAAFGPDRVVAGTNLAGWDQSLDTAHGDATLAATFDANARRLLRLP